MRKLKDAEGVDAPSADYPKGRVRDKNGAIVGTRYSEHLHGDIIQFFQKLIVDSGIVENELPDNATNGYQLIDALVDKIKKNENFTEPTVGAGWTAIVTPKFKKDNINNVVIKGLVEFVAGGTIFVLPAGYRPLESVRFSVPFKDDSAGIWEGKSAVIEIKTDGGVELINSTALGLASGDQVDFGNIRFTLDAN